MIQSFVRPRPTSSSSRFHFACRSVPVPVCLPTGSDSGFAYLLVFGFWFCLPAGFGFCIPTDSGFAYRPVSGFAYRQCSDLHIGRFPDLGNLATIIHQDKVAKVLLAQMKNEGAQGVYIARALTFLSMWDSSNFSI